MNDADDHHVDELMEEIHSQIKKEKYAELVDDSENEFDVLTEHIAQAVQDDVQAVPWEQTITQDFFPDSPRFLGAVVLLLSCFIIHFRLSDEALNYLM